MSSLATGHRRGEWLPTLNDRVLLVLCAYSGRQSILGLITASILFVVFLAGSRIYHLLARWIDGRFELRCPVRVVLYLLPVLTLLGGLQLMSRLPQPPNQQDPAVSPSGAYVLLMPIEQGCWRLTIRDRRQHVLFKDDSEFIGALSVYWV